MRDANRRISQQLQREIKDERLDLPPVQLNTLDRTLEKGVAFEMKGLSGDTYKIRVSSEEVSIAGPNFELEPVRLFKDREEREVLHDGKLLGTVYRQPIGGAEGSITAWNAAVRCYWYIVVDFDEAIVLQDGQFHVLSENGTYRANGDGLVYRAELAEDF